MFHIFLLIDSISASNAVVDSEKVVLKLASNGGSLPQNMQVPHLVMIPGSTAAYFNETIITTIFDRYRLEIN